MSDQQITKLTLKKDFNLDVLCLCETWHEPQSVSIKRLRAEGFQLLERPRPPAFDARVDSLDYVNHGGVAIVASPGVLLARLDLGEPLTFEYVCARITMHGSARVVLLVYRPGSAPATLEFFEELTSMLEQLSLTSAPIVITGDVNIRLDRPDDLLSRRFNDVVELFGLKNHVRSATHDRGGLLDVMLTRQDLEINPVEVIDVGLSDHKLIKWSMDTQRLPPVYETTVSRNWKNLKIDLFKDQIADSDLCDPDVINSLDASQLAERYNSVITTILDQMLPLVSIKCRRRASDPWFDAECRLTKKQTRRLERRFRRTGCSPDRLTWKSQLRHLHKVIRQKRSAFWSEKIRLERQQPRKLWGSINKLLGRKTPKAEDRISAEEFHSFFAKKVADVQSSTEGANPPCFEDLTDCKMSDFKPLTIGSVHQLIQNLPCKQSTLDPLPTWLLKAASAELAPAIARIINMSLTDGTVPSLFKTAVVNPRLKKPNLDNSDVKNYRPISNLSVISKLLERAVSKQLIAYLNCNNLMPSRQSAYRSCHSTETALAKVLSDILTAIDSGDISLLALLDLSAAFDTVDHDTLLQRLNKSYGLTSTALSWFSSYLFGRKQSVRCNGESSLESLMTCGVPQGSVLGPILFLLYTADVPSLIQHHHMDSHLYADDTQIYSHCHPTQVTILHNKTEQCITEVAEWMRQNRLQLNASKTEFIWFSSSRRQHQIPSAPFQVENEAVQPTTVVRNLGLYMDNDLSMRQHINRLVSTCFATLRQLKAVQRSLPREAMALLIHSLVASRIDYCNVAFAGLPSVTLMRVQTVLNAAARLLYNVRKFDHITPILRDQLHWLKVPERVDFKLCLLMYKCLHGLGPDYFHFTSISEIPARQRLRSAMSRDVPAPHTNSNIGDRAFCVSGPLAWNKLPSNIQSATSLPQFKGLLKTFLFQRSYDL
jgi:exonuclease III